ARGHVAGPEAAVADDARAGPRSARGRDSGAECGTRAGDPGRAVGGGPRGRRGRRLVPLIEELVRQIESRFAELGQQMTDPEVISDRERYAEVGRAYRQLEPAAKLAAEWRRAKDDAAGAQELLDEMGDEEGLRAELESARA